MSDVVNKLTCVCLDSVWRAIAYKTTKDAIVSLCEESGKAPNWLALDVVYEERNQADWEDKGRYDFDKCLYMNPTAWSDWINLPVRSFDFVIRAGNGRGVRVPTIIVSQNFCKTIFREVKLTKNNIMIRDNFTCQYSGKKLPAGSLNIDHIAALSRGGKNVWENVVCCDKEINSLKGDKTPEEAGLTLIKKPSKPNPRLMNFIQQKLSGHVDWNLVLKYEN